MVPIQARKGCNMNSFGVTRSPQTVLFGFGQRKALASIVKPFGSRAFICSDNRFFQDAMLAALVDDLRAAGIEVHVYDETVAELPMDCILSACAEARRFEPDVVIGIGGGSCLDIAKLVGVALSHPGSMSDFYGEFRVPGPILPVVAVPTTAGTGSEVTPVAVLADPERATKVGISSPHIIPRVAICDPELTLSCPARLTAIAGADAMTHAIEAFTAVRRQATPELAMNQVFVGKNIFSDVQARIAISALANNLAQAVEAKATAEGDRAAHEQVMLGSLAAGMAFATAGTAAAHAIQYPVGAATHTAHGLGVALLMPYVMEFNLPSCIAEYAEIAHLFGQTTQGKTDEELARQGIDAVETLFRRIGIPRSLAELGLPEGQQSWVVEQSMAAARLVNNNPRPLDHSSVASIVAAAFAGDRSRLRGI